jgi:hypothetical protein
MPVDNTEPDDNSIDDNSNELINNIENYEDYEEYMYYQEYENSENIIDPQLLHHMCKNISNDIVNSDLFGCYSIILFITLISWFCFSTLGFIIINASIIRDILISDFDVNNYFCLDKPICYVNYICDGCVLLFILTGINMLVVNLIFYLEKKYKQSQNAIINDESI